MIARGPMVLCAHPSRPYRTLPELVAAAKARPDTLTYGTTGIGSNGHLTVAALCQLTGIQLVHVPYRGAAPLLNDGTAGHVDMVISSSATVAPQVESGQLRALIQFGEQRASFIPDTPTAVEQGITSLRAYSWFGFFGPAGTPKPIIDRFYRDVVAAVRDEKTPRHLHQQVPGRGAAAHAGGAAQDRSSRGCRSGPRSSSDNNIKGGS